MFKELSKKLSQYKLRNRVIIAYLLLSLITTIILSAVIYNIQNTNVITQIGEKSVLSLKQSSSSVDTIFEQIHTIRSQMFNELDLINYIYAKSESKITTYRASLVLNRLISVYPFIHSIELYNSQAQAYFNTIKPTIDDYPYFKENADSLYKQMSGGFLTFPRIIEYYKGTIHTSDNILSFVFLPQAEIKNSSLVIINVDLKYVEENYFKTVEDNAQAHFFLINSEQKLILSNKEDAFLSDLSIQDYKSYFDNRNEGYLLDKVGSEKYLIAFTKSSNCDLYFIYYKPYKYIVGDLKETRNLILLISIATFIVSLLISILLMKNIYNPFKQLLDKLGGVPRASSDIKFFSETISKSILYKNDYDSHFEEKFIFDLLTDSDCDAVIQEAPEDLSNKFNFSSLCVYIFSIDNYYRLTQIYSNPTLKNIQNSISEIIKETLSNSCNYSITLSMTKKEIVAVCAFDNPFDHKAKYKEILDLSENMFHVTLSASIGSTVHSLKDLQTSFLIARKNIDYKIYFGHKSLIDNIKIQPFLNNDIEYPFELEKEIIISIKKVDSKSLNESIKEFKKVLYQTSYNYVNNYSLQFMHSLLKFANNININCKFPNDLLSYIHEADSIEEIVDIIKKYCNELLQDSKDDLLKVSRKHVKIVENMKSFVEDNYLDPNLSIDTISEKIGLSSEYLRKLYKQVFGISFSNYLLDFRLEKAKQLLISTDIPAMEIGKKVGLYNIPYFFTIFKKKYAETPNNFRNKRR